MDSRQRRKTTAELLRLTGEDPEAVAIARQMFGESDTGSARTVEQKIGFATEGMFWFFLAAAVTIAIFLVPRTPNSVIAGSVLLFLCLVHPAIYLPYAAGKTAHHRVARRIITLAITLVVVSAGGLVAWKETVKEQVRDVFKNLAPSVSINPQDPFISAFSISNDSGLDIISGLMFCKVNEAFGEHDVYVSDVDTGHFPHPILIKAGKDARSTQCLEPIKGSFHGAKLVCADVTLKMAYHLTDFPRPKDKKEYRFALLRTGDQYEWIREAISEVHGLCGGAELPWLKEPS
jgi:hypothetical protein